MSAPVDIARVLVVIPTFGRHDLTRAVVDDLFGDRAPETDVLIVDQRGDYDPIAGETVHRPGANKGWAGGTNIGLEIGMAGGYDALLSLNNDTRLSKGFVDGLMTCQRDTGAGLVGPFYDCHWQHQRIRRAVAPARYRSQRRHYRVPFVDGTAMWIPRSTIEAVGLLDTESFGRFAHGAEIDYGARVRAGGLVVAVTKLSYLRHYRAGTAHEVIGDYEDLAHGDMISGLASKHGDDWIRRCGLDEAWDPTRAPRRRRHRIP